MSTKTECQATEEEELAAVEHELSQVVAKMEELGERKIYLKQRQQSLKDRLLMKKSKHLACRNWEECDFPWSDKVQNLLQTVFRVETFRPYQLATINATLSKEDAILIMPTGGGKSLCYQLPALVDKGFTLVVSPLIALMEDQVMALKALNISAHMLSQATGKSETSTILNSMTDLKAPMKLLYVAPERMAKSKRFMNKLQKAHEMGRLSRIAVDEVHCCSQWGHDFRPDYKYLSVLKNMFRGVPILGLTATATTKITIDVQKILQIQGSLVLKSSFNRPNLYYEVRTKPDTQTEFLNEIEDLLKHRYSGKSGIIYTTTIKDAQELVQELRSRKVRVAYYHGNMEAELRSKVHRGWLDGHYQAVIATIAFGLGIDKPDVRFVLHHALSKSLENFYQESGRAGRDGKPADSIIFYRLADIFKQSTMVFSQHTGLDNLYAIVDYCLNSNSCRRTLIASHFDERWESKDCQAMCDHCRNPCEKKEIDITNYCRTIYKLIDVAAGQDTKLTAIKLLDAWFNKGAVKLRVEKQKAPSFSRTTGEKIVAHLIINSYLQEDFHYTLYSTLSYIKKGPRCSEVMETGSKVIMEVRGTRLPIKQDTKISLCSEVTRNESSTSSSGSAVATTPRETISSSKCESHKKLSNSKKETLDRERKGGLSKGVPKVYRGSTKGIKSEVNSNECIDLSSDSDVGGKFSVKNENSDDDFETAKHKRRKISFINSDHSSDGDVK